MISNLAKKKRFKMKSIENCQTDSPSFHIAHIYKNLSLHSK